MLTRVGITDRILDSVRKGDGQDLDSLMRDLPDLTWNQVFSEIDRLSRAGQITMTYQAGGRYLLQMPLSETPHP